MNQEEELDPAIVAALDEVLGFSTGEDEEMLGQLRALVANCLSDNYDLTDVRAVIELAKEGEAADETGGADAA